MADHYFMSPWNWPGLDYIVKFNFMYLTDISQTASEKAEILAHLQGLWQYLMQAQIPFKAHWGKINFLDAQFVHNHYGKIRQFVIAPVVGNKSPVGLLMIGHSSSRQWTTDELHFLQSCARQLA